MRIGIFFASNCFGGSVRIARFVHDLIKKEITDSPPHIHLFELEKSNTNGFFDDLNYTKMNKPRFKRDILYINQFRFYSQFIHNLDLLICFVDQKNSMLSIIASIFSKKIIISEHGNHTNTKNVRDKILKYIAYKKASYITFLTQFDMQYYKDLKNKIHIPNPIMAELLTSTKLLATVEKENIILFPSRIDSNKRLLFLLQAFNQLPKNLKNNYKIVVCGEGSERAECEKYAQNNKINLEIVGFVKNISDYYAKSKIVVLTSSSEGLPNILIESIFFDCVRVSVDCISGPNELIKHGFDGLLSEQDNINALCKNLQRVLSDQDFMQFLIQNARQRKSDFMPDVIGQKWLKIIKEISKE